MGTAMSSNSIVMPRRGFLRGLCALPLVGGGVSLIGAPTAADVPLDRQLLGSYLSWLHFEGNLLAEELEIAGFGYHGTIPVDNPGGDFHHVEYDDWRTAQHASRRAAVVLSAVGCDWRA